MTKRTRRYGGFRIGDRVRVKNEKTRRGVPEGTVIGFHKGYIKFEIIDVLGHKVHFYCYPNQLINLTRIEEKQQEIPELPPMSEETAKELDERFDAICGKIRKKPMVIFTNPTREHWTKRFIDEWLNDLPSPYTRDVYTTTKDY